MSESPLMIEHDGPIAVLSLNRPEKANAVNRALLGQLEEFLAAPPKEVGAIVITGSGKHFSGGLDLSEHRPRPPLEIVKSSMRWHSVMDRIQFGGIPVVAAMHGAVIGGGLEIAASAHVRVADVTTYYSLPEGQRGIFVGGGASVRVARIVGADRMTAMMLTGQRIPAEAGQALGLSHHLVESGKSLETAIVLARQILQNTPMSNFLIMQAIPHIAQMGFADGLFTEALAAALVRFSPDANPSLPPRERPTDSDPAPTKDQ